MTERDRAAKRRHDRKQADDRMFTVDLEPSGILRIEISGFLSRATAEALLTKVQEIAPAARRRNGGRLRSIGVTKSMPVQMALSLDYLARTAKLVFADPGDRAGLVIDSTLVRLQMKRIVPWQQIQVFTEENEARTWLASLGWGDAVAG